MSSNADNDTDLSEVDAAPPQDVHETLRDGDAQWDNEGSVRDTSGMVNEQIKLLESQLQEKEDLVFALTDRLEQAAEQLDRFRRSGAKQGRAGGGGMPRELVEEQKTLFEEMRQMMTQWAATQPGATLGRIEVQVTELRDLVSGKILSGGDLGDGGPLASGIGEALSSLQSQETATKAQAAETAPEEQFKPGSWEAQRAALMAGEPASAAGTPTTGPEPVVSEQAAAKEETTAAAFEQADTPAPIDLETADIEQWRQAVVERDQIIASLKERLQQTEESGEPSVKYDSMEGMPDEFRDKLEALEEEWIDKIRETEVELSLERAKMAREKAELQQHQHQIQKAREKLGMGSPSKSSGRSATEPDEEGGGRWLRFLKRGSGDDDD